LPNSKITSIAIGRFDGLHVGHYALFSHLGSNGAILLIDTKGANLTPINMVHDICTHQLARYELDLIAELTPSEFVDKINSDFPNLKKIIIGQDFRFGKNRAGDAIELKRLFCGETIIVDEVKIDNIGVHSKLIRAFLQNGEIAKATKFLGREFCISGVVVKGQGIGAQKLLATINLSVVDYFLPKEGVYAARFEINGIKFNAVVFVGKRLCTDGNFSIETHILGQLPLENFDHAKIYFVDFIRENRFYANLEELKIQMIQDIQTARTILEV
jgi:riboflavin kinase/FMN adenylyltransferase